MAKRTDRQQAVATEPPAGIQAMNAAEHRIEEFAEDLGRVLGATQLKATAWLEQRRVLVDRLVQVRDTATDYINQLAGTAVAAVASRRRPGRPRKQSAGAQVAAVEQRKVHRRKRRTMSAEARAKISAAQRARWAKRRS
jgi:hypothetical protein